MRAIPLGAAAAALLVGCGGSASSPVVVPLVVGLKESRAVETLEEAGLRPLVRREPYEIARRGVVISQSIQAGAHADEGETIRITVSTGPP